MANLSTVFLGTPDFAVPTLQALMAAPDFDVIAVYTQPPRQAGRGKRLRASAVHQAAENHNIPVYTPVSLKGGEVQGEFADLGADLAVVVAYGLILPKPILTAPRLGCFNLHGSLLPRWRGAAPIQRAIMAGDDVTGVCIMLMDKGLDTGPELSRIERKICPTDTAGDLHDDLAALGAPLMLEALRGVSAGTLTAKAQPETGITYASKIEKVDARIEWRLPSVELDRLIRSVSPLPGMWCQWKDERIKILLAEPLAENTKRPPGTVLDDQLLVSCGNGSLRLLRLQRPGKEAMGAEDFLRGTAILPGTVLT